MYEHVSQGIFRYIRVLSNISRYHIAIAGMSSYDNISRYRMYVKVFMVSVCMQVYAGIACMRMYYLYEYMKVLPVLLGIEGICRYILISMYCRYV